MSSLNKILAGTGLALGAMALGGYLFPETMGSLTGGMVGASTPGAYAPGGSESSFLGMGLSGVGSAATEGATAAQLAAIGSTGAQAGTLGSLFSNPSLLSAALLSGTSLISNVFGSDLEEEKFEYQKEQNEEAKALNAEQLAWEKEKFYASLEAQKAAAGAASGAAAAARDAALRQARAQAIQNNAQMKMNAMLVPLEARRRQAEAAQNTGSQSGLFFNSLIPQLQRPALT